MDTYRGAAALGPTHLLYRACGLGEVAPGPCCCCLCAAAHAAPTPVGDVILDTFTNHGLCRAPCSTVVCPACSHYFRHRWECGQKYLAEFRKHSLRIEGKRWTSWQRADMRTDLQGFLRDGCPECVLVVGLSKKKHLVPLAAVNAPGTSFLVQVEEERVFVSPATWFPLASAFDGLLALGLPKGGILSGNYPHAVLRWAGLRDVLRLDRQVAPWRPSGLLTLVSYATLTADAEEKEEEASAHT